MTQASISVSIDETVLDLRPARAGVRDGSSYGAHDDPAKACDE